MGKIINETGNRYGRLVVIREDRSKGKLNWFCQCDCGGTTIANGSDLRRGHTQSCGCWNKERTSQASVKDLTGKYFGYLEVLERDMNYQGKHIETHWICKCHACGGIKSIGRNSLHHNILSCGCLKSKGEHTISVLLNQYNIKYKSEFSFDKYKNRRFDFALLDKNNNPKRLIEFDGLQHYLKPNQWVWSRDMSLEQQQERDKEKNQIAKEYGIQLIRIPYWELNNLTIEKLLDNTFLIKEEK